MATLRRVLIRLKSSLWFIPALCVVFCSGLAICLVAIDLRMGQGLAHYWPEFFGLSAGGSRSILAAIAQSVITIAGVSFSITIVALSIAANQYTPRVLRNFMRDRANQAALGGLVGIFAYCLVVLRTIHGGERSFVPAISVVVALFMAMVAIGLFVFFIHHVASSIQASSIVSSVEEETRSAIRSVFQRELSGSSTDGRLTEKEQKLLKEMNWHPVPAESSGYLQTLEPDLLIHFACEHRTVLRLQSSIGEFVFRGKAFVLMASDRPPDQDTIHNLNGLFSIQPYRTIEQDPAFGVRQIVDIAVKALSPGINDPTTATTCLDYLSSILTLLATLETPPPCRYQSGQLRLVACWPGFEFMVQLAFREIRQNGASQPMVLLKLLDALAQIAQTARPLPPQRRAILREQADVTLQMAQSRIQFAPDLAPIRAKAGEVYAALATTSS